MGISDPIIQLRMDIDAFKAAISEAIQQLNQFQQSIGQVLGGELTTITPPSINLDFSQTPITVKGMQELAKKVSFDFVSELQKQKVVVQQALASLLENVEKTGRIPVLRVPGFEPKETEVSFKKETLGVAQAVSGANALIEGAKTAKDFAIALNNLSSIQKQLNTFIAQNKAVLEQDKESYRELLNIVTAVTKQQTAYNNAIMDSNLVIQTHKKAVQEQTKEEQNRDINLRRSGLLQLKAIEDDQKLRQQSIEGLRKFTVIHNQALLEDEKNRERHISEIRKLGVLQSQAESESFKREQKAAIPSQLQQQFISQLTGIKGVAPTLAPPTAFIDLSKTKATLEGLSQFQNQIRAEFISAVAANRIDLRSIISSTIGGFKKLEGAGASKEDVNQVANESVNAISRVNASLIAVSKQASSIKELQVSLSGVKGAQTNLNVIIAEATKRFGENSSVVQKYKAELRLLEGAQDRLNAELQKQNNVLLNSRQGFNQARQFNVDFIKLMDVAIGKIIRYRIAFTLLHNTILQIKDTVVVFADVDLALARLAKVLPDVGVNLTELRDRAFALGKTFGVSIKEVLDGMDTWAQMGLTQNEVLKATEAALLGVNTTGLTHAQVVEALTSAIFTYGVAVEDVTTVIDKWTAVQEKYPVVGADLAQALFKVGSAAEEFGITLDQLNGIVTAVQATTRASGREIGNAFKTIFARLGTQDAIRAFGRINIAIKGTDGNFRNLFHVLQDLSVEWENLSGVEQANIAQVVAGQRQYNKFLALMNNFSLAQEAANVSQNAFGSAARSNALELNTLTKSWASLMVRVDEFKVTVGEDLAKPISIALEKLKAFGDDSTGKNFAHLSSFIISAGAALITMRGAAIALKLVIGTDMVQKGILPLIAGLSNSTKGMNSFQIAAASTQATTSILAVTLRTLVTSFTFWTTAISLAIGIFTVFGNKIKQFNTDLGLTATTQEDFAKGILGRISILQEEINSVDKLLTKRQETLDSLSKLTKGSEAYTKAQATLNNIEGQLTTRQDAFSVALIRLNNGTIDQKTATEELNKAFGDLLLTNAKNIALNKQLFETSKSDFFRTLPGKVDELNNSLSNLGKSSSIIQEAFSIDVNKFFSIDPRTLKNANTLREIIDNTGIILDDLAKSNLQFSGAIAQSLDPVREKFKIIFDDIRKNADVSLFPTLENEAGLIDQILTDSQKKIQNIKLSPRGFVEWRDSVVAALEDARNKLQQRAELMPGIVRTQIAQINDELNKLKKTEVEFTVGIKPEDIKDAEGLIDQLGLQTKEVDLLRRKFIELKNSINLGEDSIKKFAQEAVLSGEPIKNIQNELAKFFGDNIKRIRDFVVSLASNIDETTSLIDDINRRKIKVTDTGEIEELDKQKAKLEANVTAFRLLLISAQQYADDVIPKQIEKTKEQNDQLAIQASNLSIINSHIKNQQDLMKTITGLMTDLGKTQKEIIAFEGSRLSLMQEMFEQEIKLANAADKESIARKRAAELTEEQLRILRQAASIDLTKNIQRLASGIQSSISVIESTLSSIPDVITEGYEKRRELTKQIKDTERELSEARISGDQDAARAAKARLDFLNDQLKESRQILFEIKAITENLFSGLSSAIFDSLSKRFAEDLSNLQIGGESLGQQMGKAISGQFDVSVQSMLSQYQSINQSFIDQTKRVYTEFLTRFAELLDRTLPELAGRAQFDTSFARDQELGLSQFEQERLRMLTPSGGHVLGTQIGATGEMSDLNAGRERDENIRKAMRSGGLLAGQIIARSIGQAGGRMGQDIASVLQTAGQMAFPKMGVEAGFLLSIGTGILGSLLGSLLQPDEEPELPRSIDRNTAAIEANTIALKEFEKGLFNAPPLFTFPSSGGAISSGGPNIGNVNVNVSVSQSGLTGVQIAEAIVTEFDRTYRSGLSRQGTRGNRVVVI